MRQVIKQDHSVAWFSLFQFISRGEREKALSIHKLLSRSINDKALIFQIEGDILLSFNENEEALDKYILSGKIYYKDNKIGKAINIYEKIVQLDKNVIYLDKLLDLYIQDNNHKKIDSFLSDYLSLMLKREGQDLQKFLSKIEILDKKFYARALSLLEGA